ncbi:hypothetical protein J7L48_02275, partial [bacterium]|nr:hypothetical protein [bacterium]
MRKKLLISIFFLFIWINISADRVNSLSALFSLSVETQKDSQTNSTGRLYYFDYNLFMEIQSPVHQIMIFSGNKLTIYYPEEKKAFLIKSKIPQMLPLFSVFIMTFESDLGLSKLGFTLEKIEKSGKTKTLYF